VTTPSSGRNIGNNPQLLFPKMSGGGGVRNNGRRGRGHGGRGGRRRGQNYTGLANKTKKGMCGNIVTNVFDYGQKSAADIMRTMWEKLVKYSATNYGQDISNELQNKISVDIIEPVHSAEVLMKQGLKEAMIRSGQREIQRARIAQYIILKAEIVANDPDAPMKLAILKNKIAQGEFSSRNKVTVELNDSEKTQFSNEWRTFPECNTNLIKHRGQAFSLIQSQCTQMLQDKIKQYT
jgi:hypothetical protein